MDEGVPTAEAVFGVSGSLAMLGWISLIIGIVLRNSLLRDLVAGLVIPASISVLYTAIVAIHWWTSPGGFDSLQSVATLFQSDWMLLAGWVHFLAFDLFVGAWCARDAHARGVPRLLLVPVLPLTFLFGPGGFVLWLMIRTAMPHADQPRLVVNS
jgi:disulfide bond formation protein DsbB